MSLLKYLLSMRLSTFCILCRHPPDLWPPPMSGAERQETDLWRFQQLDGGRRAERLLRKDSTNDNAIIGENAGTVTRSTAQSFFGATNTVQVGPEAPWSARLR
ncbi:MAG: hypothetical protein ACLT8E_01915 [Akkermansia sp.]